MTNYLEIINKVLSLGTIFLQLVTIAILINLIFFRKNNQALDFFKKHTFNLGFAITLGAILLSLFYSEIVGYPPCDLCWIQRIFIFPQIILFGINLYKKEKFFINLSMILAILSGLTAIYHIYVENGGVKGLACANPANINQTSCAIRYIYEFGYITIPVMSLTISAFLLVVLFNYKKTKIL